MNRDRPFFSIVIPTHNNCRLLKACLEVILRQTFDDFEIVVSDNASTDKTRDTVKSFRDKRIKYFRKEPFVTFPESVKRALVLAKGKYIFTIGNDDLILFADTLAKLAKILSEKQYGFLRLNYLERDFYTAALHKVFASVDKDLFLDKDEEPVKILDFLSKINIGHIAGLVFRNEGPISGKMINSEVIPWIRLVYENIKKHGGCFISNHYVVISLPPQIPKMFLAYNATDNERLMYEYYTDYVFSIIPKPQREEYKKRYYSFLIPLLPSVKLYSNNLNLVKFATRLLKIEPSMKFRYQFWFYFTAALIPPKFIWRVVRYFYQRFNDKIKTLTDYKVINSRFQYLYNRYY